MKGSGVAAYQIEMTEVARSDLSTYSAAERKLIVSEIRGQLMHQPTAITRNRKALRDNSIARWELRVGKFRVFYEVDEENRTVVVVAVGHKEHEKLMIRGEEVQL